jgi:hypothetical protein
MMIVLRIAIRSPGAHDDAFDLHLPLYLELRVPGAGLFQSQLPGKIFATRVVAILMLVYAGMHAASALRSFYFFQRIERLEGEARRLAGIAAEGPNAAATRKQIVSDVGALRHAGEVKAYIDLLFLALVILLCIAKIVTN